MIIDVSTRESCLVILVDLDIKASVFCPWLPCFSCPLSSFKSIDGEDPWLLSSVSISEAHTDIGIVLR